MAGKTVSPGKEKISWLLIFYSIPAKPVGNRVRIWRRLSKTGALLLKGAIYVLPYTEEHYEFCQWLMTEINAAGGDGDFVHADKLEMLNEAEIIELFNMQRELECKKTEKGLAELEMRLNSIKKGTRTKDKKAVHGQLDKLIKEFSDVKRTDFFSSAVVAETQNRIDMLLKEIERLFKAPKRETDKPVVTALPLKNRDEYRGREWATRKNPFVDRMASAWLIRKFIAPDAVFRFIDERNVEHAGKGYITFDIQGGEFTHTADMCTFEILMKTFAIKDRSVRKIAELVHEIDMKDDKYSSPAAQGIEEILLGIRKTGRNNTDILEKGMSVFEMLYASRTL